MTLFQKVVVVLVAGALVMSGIALIRGDIHSAALGVFVSAVALITNFGLWPTKPLWRRRKS
jgi:hypothetical protein